LINLTRENKLAMSAKPPNVSGTTFLTGIQAAQMLEKLKNANGQTIKIQTLQINPETGAKQIVAIPIQSAPTSSQNLIVSPMKSLRTSEGSILGNYGGRTIKMSSPRTVAHSGMRVSLSSAQPSSVHAMQQSSSSSPQLLQTFHSASGPIIHGVQGLHSNPTVHGVQSLQSHQITHRVTLTPQKAQGVAPLRFPRQNLQFESVGVKRPAEQEPMEISDPKRRKTEKGGKGLRHFSMKVCEKVKAKGTTTYNEVADELVAELTDPRCQSPSDPQYDQKNIRRRVYDALNVLMAMNIISKEKKEIRWLGLPTNSLQEANSMENDKAERLERIKTKTKQLQDLILQQIAFKNLVERNREAEKVTGAPTPNSTIQLPFIIVGTSKKTVIDCSISDDKMEYLFNFDNTFEIHDDMEVLKKMKMTMGLENGTVDEEKLRRARNMVPRALQSFVDDLASKGADTYNTSMLREATVQVKSEVGLEYAIGDEDVLEESD